mmetsp:Transcript_102711/g.257506  ORF Transcript_102711/g.257506 Transcript_102711/m.257506 type:complete len:222 (+) Transcript_102711:413-1078(+)
MIRRRLRTQLMVNTQGCPTSSRWRPRIRVCGDISVVAELAPVDGLGVIRDHPHAPEQEPTKNVHVRVVVQWYVRPFPEDEDAQRHLRPRVHLLVTNLRRAAIQAIGFVQAYTKVCSNERVQASDKVTNEAVLAVLWHTPITAQKLKERCYPRSECGHRRCRQRCQRPCYNLRSAWETGAAGRSRSCAVTSLHVASHEHPRNTALAADNAVAFQGQPPTATK